MSAFDPTNTSVNDLCLAALRECGAIGLGQNASAIDISETWSRLQWMLQEWQRERWLNYCLQTLLFTSTGAVSYTCGPGGNFDTGAGSARPDKIEAAFVRQLTQSQPNQIDYPLEILQSMEDYDKIALKQLKSFPSRIFYSPTWPLGEVCVWPLMQANIYATGITIKVSLPQAFGNLASVLALPYEYYSAILYNLAWRLRSKYAIPTFQGDPLPGLAKASLNTLRGANTAIARLQMPGDLNRSGIYNIFSDTFY